ncbi:MAG: LysR family transcriptional regulator [Pseudomonadales bacterium]
MARLNYHHLYYFWRVASEGNLTRVASSLHVSQSALSSQIRQLEESSGTRLFERQGRALVLTDSGRRVLAYANDIFAKGEELESLLRHGIEPKTQLLRIGMLSTISRNFIDAFVAPLLNDRTVRFSLHARNLDGLLEGLVKHQLDVALTNSSVQGNDEQVWQSQLLARQPVSIVGPPKGRPRGRFPRGYARKRWVLPAAPSEVRSAFDAFCTVQQFEPDVQAEADDMAMLRLLARDSGALAVLPTVVVRDEIQQGVLREYMSLPSVFESFYAITIRRSFVPAVLQGLLAPFTQADATPP